jgi:RHS repeat-associated protein
MADVNRYRFASQEYDPQTGLYAYLYRFYDPNSQRWLNQDPIQEAGGLNLYAYVANNPVNKIDPLGLYNPISGPSGPVGPGSGLADPSVYLPQMPPASSFPGANGGGNGYEMAGTVLGGFGLLSPAGEYGPAAAATIGSNGRMYWPTPSRPYGWGGGSRGGITTCKVGELSHGFGVGLFWAQTGVEGIGYLNGDVSGEKFSRDTGVGALGFTGPGGAIFGGEYYLIDTFYPGGWGGYMTNLGNTVISNQQISPYTDNFPILSGP